MKILKIHRSRAETFDNESYLPESLCDVHLQTFQFRNPAPVVRNSGHEQLIISMESTRKHTGKKYEPQYQLLVPSELADIREDRIEVHRKDAKAKTASVVKVSGTVGWFDEGQFRF